MVMWRGMSVVVVDMVVVVRVGVVGCRAGRGVEGLRTQGG